MAKRGATIAILTFTRQEEHLIERIDRNSARRREFVSKTTEALRFTTCSIIARKRKHKPKQRLMNQRRR
jgi:hypothetical protein